MVSEEARKIIDALHRDELILEINKGRRSRFSDDNYAYLKTRLSTIEAQQAKETREADGAHKEEELKLGRQANELAVSLRS